MILLTGVTGKSGRWFLNQILEDSKTSTPQRYRALVRSTSNCTALDKHPAVIEKKCGDLNDATFLHEAMEGVSTVFHVAGIHTSLKLVQVAASHGVKRIVLVHTTGIYSKYKTANGDYLEIERQINEIAKAQDIRLTILRPTMIYGSIKDNNVVVFIKMVNKLKILPVVNHANYLLQPVHEKDLGDAYFAVLKNLETTANKSYILSGKEPILLIDMFRCIGKYLNKNTYFLSIPFPFAYSIAWTLYLLTLGKMDYREKVQRLVEDRAFSHAEASQDFGYSPMRFEEGIREEITEYVASLG